MNFFWFNFPLREYFFLLRPLLPPPPHKFSNGPSLTETAICVVEQWKESMFYCSVPEFNHAQESHVLLLFQSAKIHGKVIHVNFFLFFLPYLQDHSLLKSRNFATLAMWRLLLSPQLALIFCKHHHIMPRALEWSSEPGEGLAICGAKAVPLSPGYFETLKIGPAQRFESATTLLAV